MKINTSDKAIAWLTLLSGLTISAVAIYYSVAGLVAIFAAAVIPIIVMGVALEISKLAATVWLKQNWTRAPNFIRGYLMAAIAILMIITSMGIFGFLSKAHSDQSLVSGDVQSKISIYDEKIKTAKENIEANRKALKQMDEAVDQVMGRSSDEKGADKAVALRRNQAKERARLQDEIGKEQKVIAKLNEEAAPIRAEVRKVEAEVGPIKYIAKLIYGDNPDANLLEKAVTWVIIIIVIVFDPLAVILLLASQYSFQWFRTVKEESNDEDAKDKDLEEFFQRGRLVAKGLDADEDKRLAEEANSLIAEIPKESNIEQTLASVEQNIPAQSETVDSIDNITVEQWNQMVSEAEKAVEEEKEKEDQEILEEAPNTIKEAMAKWKAENPEDSLKRQKRLLARGIITELPWEKYLQAQPDFTDDEAAQEAAKWAMEQIEKKAQPESNPETEVKWMENENGQTVKKIKDTYKQNAEQSNTTLWQRIQETKK